ncbi:MAG: type 2 isopentenyl-diphosphate Delta-isomerase [Bacteroidota bacterium]
MTPRRPAHRSATTSRKQQHITLALQKDVRFKSKTTGLERFDFVHNALPEIALSEVDTSIEFLRKRLLLPLMISSMTGGYPGAREINRNLAMVCAEAGLAMGVGSQRQALEDTLYHDTYAVVREISTDIPVVGNIGAAEVGKMKNADGAGRLVDMIRADALAVHLNPLQELLQPEGEPDFRGVLRGIEMLVRALPVPVIVKEIGAGISREVARRLLDAGVRHIDIAGAGGTSWAGVETLRSRDRKFAGRFWDWGIPTAEAIRQVAALKEPGRRFTLIGSGGIQSGRDIGVAIALGADLAASARPLLQTLASHGIVALRAQLAEWTRELRAIMFLTGSRTIPDLQSVSLEESLP